MVTKRTSAAKPARGRPSKQTPEMLLPQGIRTLPAPELTPEGKPDGLRRGQHVPYSRHLSLGWMTETNGGSSLENVSRFDFARARTEGLLQDTIATRKARDESPDFRPENVIGDTYDLVPVPDTTALPWRCIALLTITYQNGARSAGTAWFMGPNVLGTAGHNIFKEGYGAATEILVSPGFNGKIAPFATYRVKQTYCDPKWSDVSIPENLRDPFDYGVLILEDSTVGQSLGWFGIAAYDDKQLKKMLVNVSGYPTIDPTKPDITQHYNGGRLHPVDKAFLHYTFDTDFGMSGAPIFALFGDQRVVVGIHTSGTDTFNRARRIDPGLYATLMHFIEQ